MKAIIKFLSKDGCEFASEEACLAHEALCEDVARAEKHLLPRPMTSAFSNGEGFVQQTASVALVFQRYLIRVVQKNLGENSFNIGWDAYLNADFPIGFSYLGRIVREEGPAAVRAVWWRLQCMDDQFREYGQPYFALQANKNLSR